MKVEQIRALGGVKYMLCVKCLIAWKIHWIDKTQGYHFRRRRSRLYCDIHGGDVVCPRCQEPLVAARIHAQIEEREGKPDEKGTDRDGNNPGDRPNGVHDDPDVSNGDVHGVD